MQYRTLFMWIAIVVAINVLRPSLAREPLTFEERVKAQEAIERVYFDHRIWPADNPDPKPTFDALVPRVLIENKVVNYLKKCVALDRYWQQPIQSEQLQAEVDRMSKGSKNPTMLQELFDALGNDPYLIAECLARPILADRLIRSWYASDHRFHEKARSVAEDMECQISRGGHLSDVKAGSCQRIRYTREPAEGDPQVPSLPNEIRLSAGEYERLRSEMDGRTRGGRIQESDEGFILEETIRVESDAVEIDSVLIEKQSLEAWLGNQNADVRGVALGAVPGDYLIPAMEQKHNPEAACIDGWADSSLLDYPDAKSAHTAVWTGSELLVWGGSFDGIRDSGWRYNPSTDTWAAISRGPNCPSRRRDHTSVWTGSEMVIWGGDNYGVLNSGGRYNPATDTWTATSRGANCPTARYGHTAIWVAPEMIVWGGYSTGYLNSGARYNPTTDTWIATSSSSGCPSARYRHTAVWTGNTMVIWGGFGGSRLNSGGQYTPSTNTWTATSTASGCPTAREYHTAVWTGSEMIIWGGYGNISPYYLNTGAHYSPTGNTWTATPITGDCPTRRAFHTAVWTGTRMIVWGGTDGTLRNTGGLYDPSARVWAATSTGANCPSARSRATAVWTDSEMIVWGGGSNTGGRYSPSANTWLPTATSSAPSPRLRHSAIWTGAEMIVWGGFGADRFRTGGRYTPATDSWQPTSTGTNCPTGRDYHICLWTGSEMLIWGGFAATTLPDGGRYSPSGDIWSPIPVSNTSPGQRFLPSGVWTGTEMIIWGGTGDGGWLNTGSRYSPASDIWTLTPTGGDCPQGRNYHTAIWTGSEMVVWGGWIEGATCTDTGGRYSPSTASWQPTATGGACPSAREPTTAVWTGSEMLIWGGRDGLSNLSSGARYNPASNAWLAMPQGGNCPEARYNHSAVWTGRDMIIWGGTGLSTDMGSGGRYDPVQDIWSPTPQDAYLPLMRAQHSAVWADGEMILWGGSPATLTGGIYIPGPRPAVLDGPTVTDIDGCLSGVGVSWPADPTDWNDPGSGSRSYRVLRDGVPVPGGGCSGSIAYGVGQCTDDTAQYGVNHSYRVQYINACGGSAQSPAGLDQDFGPQPPPVTGESNPCAGSTVTLATDAFSGYQWAQDGVDIPGATAQTLDVTQSAIYTVRVAHAGGCTGISEGKSVLFRQPAPSVSGPGDLCEGSLATLSTGSFAFYQWTQDGSDIPGGTSQTLDVTASGSYAVRVQDWAGCTGTSEEHQVTFHPLPLPTITGLHQNACGTYSIQLSTQPYSMYQWFLDGAGLGDGTGQTYEATSSGTYTVNVADSYGCWGTSPGFAVTIDECVGEVSPEGASFKFEIVPDLASSTGYFIYFEKSQYALGYSVYEGTLSALSVGFYDHGGMSHCDITVDDLGTGQMRAEIQPMDGDHYYLITAHGMRTEGPSGYRSTAVEIDPMMSTCPP